jgi:glycosyltransferase involved in cell wall biosynthesis
MAATTISIITAAKNASSTILDCLASVQHQDYPAEHIVIDGASSDDTLRRIKNSGANVSRIVSEPDKGIYDAMNKGLALATGDVIGILNADDFYAHPHVLSKVAAAFEDPRIDACYGDLVYVNRTETTHVVRVWKSENFDKDLFYKGWMPPHPTFFVRRSVYEKYGNFNTDIGTAADYELVLRFLFRYGCEALHIPDILVVMRLGGVSNVNICNRVRTARGCRRAWVANKLKPKYWTLLLRLVSKPWQYALARSVDFTPCHWWNDSR